MRDEWLLTGFLMRFLGLLLAACALAMPLTAVEYLEYLEGKVTIGLLHPAQRVNEPRAPLPAEVYAAYPIKILVAPWLADEGLWNVVDQCNKEEEKCQRRWENILA